MSHRHLTGRGLRFSYTPGAEVLTGADVDVRPGSRVALLGANGSGKSTLLQCLAGTLKPTAGEISVDGTTMDWSRRALRAHRQTVQLVFQNPDDQLFSADVADDVAYGPMNLGLSAAEIRSRVDSALNLLSLDDLRHRPIHQLSFGERKRVAIAGAIAMRPCVLLFDEPTAGVDPAGVDELFSTLEILEKAGTTVALSTHDTALALQWADFVAVMHDGVIRQGTPLSILDDANLVAAARLQTPWLLSLTSDLIRDGVLPPTSRPTSTAGLRDALKRAATNPAFTA
ncbi:energy-coupling factor ABC transporter ATP-binding protein [Mycolicibacterium goodii]|uniref:ABC transporter ATP-binding protein n=1 Tax=Mycolicibacterium goodii TaxID=134601 RepID=A0A0K0X8U9_MYCGD|nr:cobalt ABC transporter ATP-binding protein [Mycolicibacterium goodii]